MKAFTKREFDKELTQNRTPKPQYVSAGKKQAPGLNLAPAMIGKMPKFIVITPGCLGQFKKTVKTSFVSLLVQNCQAQPQLKL